MTEANTYAGLSHGHLPATQETPVPHVQPSPQPVNHQENSSQSNGSGHLNNAAGQQQTKGTTGASQNASSTEAQRPEGVASYAGIAKMNSALGSVSNANSASLPSGGAPRSTPTNTSAPVPPVPSAPTAPNTVRPPMKPGMGRPSNYPQGGPGHFNQGRGGNNYYQQNNRNHPSNENFE